MSGPVCSISQYLHLLVDKNGSDLHLKAGGPAHLRVNGELAQLHELPSLTPTDTARFAAELLDAPGRERFAAGEEVDCAYAIPGVGRFRVAAFRQRGSAGLVLRRVLPGSQSFASLGLPPAVRRLAEEHRGLVLVTGPTGSVS